MNKFSLITIGILLTIIVFLGAVLIFKKNPETGVNDKERILRDSIAILQKDISLSQERQTKIQKDFDSLQSIDQQVIYRTREKIKFIFNTSDPSILDSLIRSNWRTKF